MRQARIIAQVILVVLVLTSAVLPAHAAMTLVSRDTELSASGPCVSGDTTCTPSPQVPFLVGHTSDSYTGFGDYSKSINYFQEGFASQQSSISSTHISVQTLASGGVSSGIGDSDFTLKFSLDAPEQFTLTDVINNQVPDATNLVQLVGPNGVVFADSIGIVGPPASGVLNAPGLYFLVVQSHAEAVGFLSAFAQTNADLKLTPVPLPGSLALVASGVLGVLLLARRRTVFGPR